jgi:ribonuclease P protein component
MQRRHRLFAASDYAALRHRGKVRRHRLFTISYLPNGLDYNRYGFVTSKKIGGAVTRNRTRRRLREVMRQLHPMLKSGFDVVLIAHQPLLQQPFSELLGIASTLLHQAELLVSEIDENPGVDVTPLL